MNVNRLPAVILLFVALGMLLGVGLIVLIEVGDAGRDLNVATAEEQNYTTTYNLANEQVNEITSVVNGTNTLTSPADYNATITDTTTSITMRGTYVNNNVNVTYSYYTDSDTTTAMDDYADGVDDISDTWVPLIVTVLALAIILGLVLRAFTQGR